MVAASAQLPPRPCPPLAPGAELPKPAPAHLASFMGSSSFSNAIAQPNSSFSFLSGLAEQPMSPVSPLTLVPLAALPPLNMSTQQNGDVAGFMQLQQTLAQMQQMSSPLSNGAPSNAPMMPLTPTSNTAVSVAAQQLQQLQQAQMHLQQMAQAQQAQLLQLQVTAGLPFMVQLIGAIQAHPPLLLIEELGFLREFLAAQGVDIHRYGGSNPPTPNTTPVSTTATAGGSFPATSPITSNPPTPVTVTSSNVGFGSRLEVPHEGMRGATPDSQASESTQGMSDASSRASTPACNQFGMNEMNPFSFDVPSSISACWDSPRSNANASPIEGLMMHAQVMMHTPNMPSSSMPAGPVVKPSPQRPTANAGMQLKASQVPSSASAPADLFGEVLTTEGEGEDSKDKALIDPRKYKTRMCRNWMQTGACSYEHACCFAHGEAELRDPAANVVVLSSLGYFTTKRLRDGPQ